MAQLQWRDVNAPDFSGSAEGFRTFSSLLESAFGGLKQSVNRFDANQTDRVNQELMRQALAITDSEQYAAALPEMLSGPNADRLTSQNLQFLGGRVNDLLDTENTVADMGWEERERDRTSDNWTAQDTADPVLNRISALRAAGKNDEADAYMATPEAQAALSGLRSGDFSQALTTGQSLAAGDLSYRGNSLNFNEQKTNVEDTRAAQAAFARVRPSITSWSDFEHAMFNDDAIKTMSPGARIAFEAMGRQNFGGPTPAGDLLGGGGGAPGSIPGESLGGASTTEAFVDRVLGAETGGTRNPNNARPLNPDGTRASSALGAGQFLDSTWVSTVTTHRPDLIRGRTREQVLALRSDPAIMRQMTIAHTGDNERALSGAGIPVTDTTRYLAHFLGYDQAIRVLRNPNAPINETVNAASRTANRSVFEPSRGPRITNGAQLISWAAGKMGSPADVSYSARAADTQADVNQADVDPFVAGFRERAGQTEVTPAAAASRLTGEGGALAGMDNNAILTQIQTMSSRRYRRPDGSTVSINPATAAWILENSVTGRQGWGLANSRTPGIGAGYMLGIRRPNGPDLGGGRTLLPGTVQSRINQYLSNSVTEGALDNDTTAERSAALNQARVAHQAAQARVTQLRAQVVIQPEAQGALNRAIQAAAVAQANLAALTTR